MTFWFNILISVGFLTQLILLLQRSLPYLSSLSSPIPDSRREPLPAAEIILCLRGQDPFLDRCLSGLANQNYPEFHITIVLDSPDDSAAPQAVAAQAEFGEQRIRILSRDRLIPTCSQRASSLLTALDTLPDSTEMVVLCDGDAVTHPTWLRELAAPIAEGAPATSGNRWYVPIRNNLGSLVRYFWNALAVIQMSHDGILWAGSMALSGDYVRSAEFSGIIRRAFSEDTAVSGQLKRQNRSVKPLTTLPVINEETITLAAFYGFLERQMLAARLHHPNWWKILTAACVQAVPLFLLPAAVLLGTTAVTVWCSALLAYGITAHIVIGRCEYLVRRRVRERDAVILPKYTLARMVLAAPALTVLGFVYPIATIRAAITRTHRWRGICYRITRHGVHREEPGTALD